MTRFWGRLSACLLFFAVMSSPAVWAQEAAPAAGPAPAPAAADQPATADLSPAASPPPAAAPQPGSSAVAAPVSAGSGVSLPGGLELLKGLGAFVLVLVLLYLALKALGRLGRFKGRGGRRGREAFFELRGIQALDNRKYLAAVEAEGRIIIVGVTPDRVTPVAQWIAEPEEDDLDLSSARLPADEPGLEFKLPEEDDPPLDISVADQDSERP